MELNSMPKTTKHRRYLLECCDSPRNCHPGGKDRGRKGGGREILCTLGLPKIRPLAKVGTWLMGEFCRGVELTRVCFQRSYTV